MRALRLLAAALPGESPDHLAQLSIGQRDNALLNLRARVFGRRMEALALCPACGETLEMVLDAEDLRVTATAEAASAWRELPEHGVRVRSPNSADLLAVITSPSQESAVAALVERCVQPLNGEVGDVPLERLEDAILGADPLAELDLALSCPVCSHTWVAPLDVPAFVWAEVDAWAMRVLQEVHLLASAYGWSESEILRLAPRRRQAYLDMIGA